MQELRFVAVSEDGSYAVLAVPGRSARFTLPIDERLRAVALGQTSRLAQYEIEVESPLRPKEIQARIRAGETAEEIADAAGIPVERVRWFEGPVLAERAYIATQAQSASVRRQGDSAPGPRLGDIVTTRIPVLGGAPEDAEWDSRKRGDGNWQVSLTFPSNGRLHIAEWLFDPRRRHVMPADEAAERLSLPESELPPLTASVPGEATVTPLAPRLGAVAAGGATSGGYGSPAGYGSHNSAGHAGGGSRYRPDRPAERTERPPADRRAQERPGYEPPAAYAQPPGHSAQPPAYPQRPVPAPPETRASRPAQPGSQSVQPPAFTPSPGHGLVPMWEPPAWDPTPAPPAERAATREPSAPAPAEPMAFEEPAPVLSGAGLNDAEFEAASIYLDTAEPVTAEQASAGQAAVEPAPEPPGAAPAAPAAISPEPVPAAAGPAPAPVAASVTADPPAAKSVPANPTPAESAVAVAAAPADATAAPEPAAPEPAAAAAPAQPPAAVAAPVPAEVTPPKPEPAPQAAEAGQPEAQRPRQPKNAKAKGRRSSVPSWDEIMLGSSRQRD
jgi:Protein of unknown function (DUF3071)